MPRGKFVNAAGVHEFVLHWPADTIVRVKSGNGTVDGEQVSWLVGALETGGKQYLFASRARGAAGTLGTTSGADLALRVLNTAAFAPTALAQTVCGADTPGLVELWAQGKPAFGVYAPNENPESGPARSAAPARRLHARQGGETLAMNPLYDYVFLNLEGRYDAAAVKAMAEGLRSPNAVSRKALIVRIPPIDVDGAAAAKARVKEALDLGADGVTIPHVTSVEEAEAGDRLLSGGEGQRLVAVESGRPHGRAFC